MKTCVRGRARLPWGLGSIEVNVLGREDDLCVFDYTDEVEGGYTIYRCRVPVTEKSVSIRSEGAGIATSFSLKDAHVLHRGNLLLEIGGDRWHQRGIGDSGFVNHYLDRSTGTGAEARTGSRVKIRYTVYQSRRFDVPNAKAKVMEFKLSDDADPGLAEAVRGMKVGGKRAVLIREEVLPALSKTVGGIQSGTQVAIVIELLEAN